MLQHLDKPAESVCALDRACDLLGGRGALAEILRVSIAAIGNWKFRGVPIDRCVAIERATQGAITRRDLRPDDWPNIWPELANEQRLPQVEDVQHG